MSRKTTSNPLTFHEPTPEQEADFALERAAERAVLNHPETKKLRKAIMAGMKKAAKAPAKKSRKS